MHLKLDPTPFATVPPAVRGDGTYQPVSYWQTTIDVTPGEPLREAVECDVVIIGGGYSGLSVARHLKQLEPKLDVVVLEHSVVGHGASGRNGGFAMPLLGWDLYETVKALGEKEGKRAYDLMYRAVDDFKRLIHEEQIDCDLECTGYLLVNTCAMREKRARQEYELAHQLGYEHQWLEGAALEEYIRCEHFRSGVFDPHPCIVNPAKLARGLKASAEKLGVRIYERSPMQEMSDGATVTVRTPEGSVKARQACVCLNGFGESVGFMKNRVLPVHTYIVLTEPLSDAQLNEIGWAKHRASIETARNFIHYFRLTADNRIAFGGEDADIYKGGVYQTNDSGIEDALRERFREYFPSLAKTKFTHAWGGVLGVTLDMFPTFGQSGAHKNVFHACGYSGHGVSLSNHCGALLAPVMLRATGRYDFDAPKDLPFFWNRAPMQVPGDPYRYWGMKAYRAALRAHDFITRA